MSAIKLPDAALLGAVADLLGEEQAARHADVRELVAENARGRERLDEYGNVIATKFDALELKALAHIDARVAALNLKNGEPGADGLQGERGERGERGDVGLTGPTGIPGERGERGEQGPQGERGERGEAGLTVEGPQGPQGERGKRGEKGDKGDAIEGPQGPQGERGEMGPQGWPGERGERGEKGDRGEAIHGPQGERGEQGLPGERGPQGERGADAYAGRARGLYKADEKYRALDTVALNGNEWRALRDNPGPCPGEGDNRGWMLSARGSKGEPGKPGPAGPQGKPGVSLRKPFVDVDKWLIGAELDDGTKITWDLFPFFDRLSNEIAA